MKDTSKEFFGYREIEIEHVDYVTFWEVFKDSNCINLRLTPKNNIKNSTILRAKDKKLVSHGRDIIFMEDKEHKNIAQEMVNVFLEAVRSIREEKYLSIDSDYQSLLDQELKM